MKRTNQNRDSYHQNPHITHYNHRRSNESITPVDKQEYMGNTVRSSNFIHRKYHSSSNNDNVETF